MNPFIKFTKFIAFCAVLSSISHSKPLELWISSFQDQVYYEKMAEMFAKKSKGFELEVKAYGFREMPDKLGVALRTGEGIPDLVQLDETFF
jgi:ABC-type glycerol-3-phosphate transport system substrate-binding protein